MSRTNHHRRYDRWNIEEPYFDYYNARTGDVEREWHHGGMEIHDLRFYAGCRRRPQAVHRVLDFHGLYAWRIHYGREGTAKSYADIREGQYRTAVRGYLSRARSAWNAGEDVEELREPERRPRSIDWDLW